MSKQKYKGINHSALANPSKMIVPKKRKFNKKIAIIEDLKESMKQKWTQNSYAKTWEDQFGFVIHYGSFYRLQWHDQSIITHSLTAAQLISTILLNDSINKKQ